MIVDAGFGEPRWLWSQVLHPVVLAGRFIALCEQIWRTSRSPRCGGLMTLILLLVVSGSFGWLLSYGGIVIEIAVVSVMIAQRSLVDHVAAVANALRLSVEEGRWAVARIVGRDTSQMDAASVARAAIESAAENLSDAVIAPAFWFLLAGLPGIVAYKFVNTADSMIGHRTDRYLEFGWATARFDDLINFIPARLTALFVLLTSRSLHRWGSLRHDAIKHRSPNAGWPEAAVAQVLGVALSGPRQYDGKQQDFPFVFAQGGKDIGANEIEATVALLWKTWWTLLAILLMMTLILLLLG